MVRRAKLHPPYAVPDFLEPPGLTCADCGHLLEPKEFPLRPDGKRSKVCRQCQQDGPWQKEVQQRRERMRRAIQQLYGAAAVQKIQAPHVTELCAGLVAQWGSLEEFCKDWKCFLDFVQKEAYEKKSNLRLVHDMYVQIAKVIHASTQERASAPDMAQLSDEDLEAEITQAAGRALMAYEQVEDPGLVDDHGNGDTD